MAREKGSVRIGPVSVFSLVIILGLAVLAVLSAATSHASNAEAQTQASFTASAYANDAVAAESLAAIDSALAREAAEQSGGGGAVDGLGASFQTDGANDSASSRSGGIIDDLGAVRSDGVSDVFDVDSAMDAVSEVLPQGNLVEGITAVSSIEGNAVQMVFSAQDGRTLTVSLEVCDNLTYEVTQWRVTTEWNQEPEENKLWSGE